MSLVLSAKMRRKSSQNKGLWQTLDNGNVLGLTFSFKNSQQFQFKKQKILNNINTLDFYLPTWEKIAPPYTSPDQAHNILSDRLWTALP